METALDFSKIDKQCGFLSPSFLTANTAEVMDFTLTRGLVNDLARDLAQRCMRVAA